MQCSEIRFLWVDLDICGTFGMVARPLFFLSTFLLRAHPLEMRLECWESFPKKAVKATLITSYEVETGLLLMSVVPSALLSEWRRVCREVLELLQGCEGTFRSSRGKM